MALDARALEGATIRALEAGTLQRKWPGLNATDRRAVLAQAAILVTAYLELVAARPRRGRAGADAHPRAGVTGATPVPRSRPVAHTVPKSGDLFGATPMNGGTL
jgi:hypothetical protein